MTSNGPQRFPGSRIDREPLLDDQDVMKWLNISRPILRKYVKSGQLKTVPLMRHRRYHTRDVIDFIDSKRTQPKTNRSRYQ